MLPQKYYKNIICEAWIIAEFVKMVWTIFTEGKRLALELNSNWVWTASDLKWHWTWDATFLECHDWWNISLCQDLDLGKTWVSMEKDCKLPLTNFGNLNLNSNWNWKMDMTFYHHMKMCHSSPCQVSELGETLKLHEDSWILHVGCYTCIIRWYVAPAFFSPKGIVV